MHADNVGEQRGIRLNQVTDRDLFSADPTGNRRSDLRKGEV